MAALNTELAQMARDCIAEMRQEGWEEDDIKWSTCGGILKHLEAQDADFEPTKENMAAIQVLVKQVMNEGALRQCPYCQQWHEAQLIEECSLKPKMKPHIQ